MLRWLSGFWAQAGPVANCRFATFFRRLGEAAAPGGGECGRCPDFASYTLAFALQLRKITEILSQGRYREVGRAKDLSAPRYMVFIQVAARGAKK